MPLARGVERVKVDPAQALPPCSKQLCRTRGQPGVGNCGLPDPPSLRLDFTMSAQKASNGE